MASEYSCHAGNNCVFRTHSKSKLHAHYSDRHGAALAGSPAVLCFQSSMLTKRKRPSKDEK
jgi:hypothetical protein